MDPERWRTINEIFDQALEREEGERAAFLHSACGDDVDLRREVESLLASHANAEDFIETPAYEIGAALLHGPSAGAPPRDAESIVGQRLGPYAVKARLGYGGMGVVYLAEDTRLDRLVAIKALAEHLGRDARSRERLRREAKAAAALSHPGIATVFALEEFDGRLYIVYEYVEGMTLREELEEGPLRGKRLIGTALAVARALEAAHARDIVHRDLKPENVIRTSDQGIKILDFGIASLPATGPARVGSGGGPARLTLPGMLLGTPSYMAPEQLKGQDVDFRADLFAFGIMLHEMASGLHPFKGGDPASTIARILELEPRGLPEPARADLHDIEPVLHRLLRKRPQDRYSSTSDLIADLERIDVATPQASAESAPVAARAAASITPAPVMSSGDDAPLGGPRHDAFWWWRFHQFAVSLVYGSALCGLWWAQEWTASGPASSLGTALFYAGLVPVVGAGSLRLHLAFAARYYPGELWGQLRRASPWIRRAEWLYAPMLLAGAVLIAVDHPFVAAPMVAAAIGIPVFSRMIEPATTRAAFHELRDTS